MSARGKLGIADQFLKVKTLIMVSSSTPSRGLTCITMQTTASAFKSLRKALKSSAVAGGLAMAASGAMAQSGSQSEITLYTGANAAPHSSVKFSGASTSYGIADGSYSTEGWKADPFNSPVYWGFRYTYWPAASSPWGYGVDINHSKLYAKGMPENGENITRLEFSDGMNTLMANLYRRYPGVQSLWGGEPYWGVGLGVSYPHVEVSSAENRTFEYQYTGFAAQAMVGLRYSINEKWLAFGELRTQYIPVEADLDGGGKLEVDFINNHFSLGVSRLF
jgi:lipid A oxidase